MADVTLASRPAAGALVGDEKLYGEQGGSTKYITPAQIAAYVRTTGQYTPVAAGTANVAAVTADVVNYVRQGNLVTVSGTINITPTAPNVLTTATISIPVASVFASAVNAAGTLSGKPSGVTKYEPGVVNALNGGSVLVLSFAPTNAVAHALRFMAMYEILP